jgi:hypothetical protein
MAPSFCLRYLDSRAKNIGETAFSPDLRVTLLSSRGDGAVALKFSGTERPGPRKPGNSEHRKAMW